MIETIALYTAVTFLICVVFGMFFMLGLGIWIFYDVWKMHKRHWDEDNDSY